MYDTFLPSLSSIQDQGSPRLREIRLPKAPKNLQVTRRSRVLWRRGSSSSGSSAPVVVNTHGRVLCIVTFCRNHDPTATTVWSNPVFTIQHLLCAATDAHTINSEGCPRLAGQSFLTMVVPTEYRASNLSGQ